VKFPDKEYTQLKHLSFLQLSFNPDLRLRYQSEGFSDARFRWDLMWSIVDSGAFDLKRLYNSPYNLNDEHVDTALRRIVSSYYKEAK
jgi:hypothetical protein